MELTSPHRQHPKKEFPILALLILGVFAPANDASADLFRHITAEANADIHDDGNLTENGVTYRCIYKPDPPATWVHPPLINSAQHYVGTKSIAMKIDPVASYAAGDVDKVNHRISSGNDSFALGFGVKRYTGFAINIPSTHFQIPEVGRKLMLAQWWQGSPYGPPVRLAITDTPANSVTFRFLVLNNDTLGNPSATPIDIGGGTIPFDTWNAFVVMLLPDHTGSGQIEVWHNGTSIITWTGKVGYDPSTIPYKNPRAGTPHPNPKFDVFYGPYRDRQDKKHLVFFDEIKFADTYTEAAP